MIELNHNQLQFSFPEVHDEARLSIECQRTLRIPDDGEAHCLPPGLGEFPMEHVDDHAGAVPEMWRKRGGVMLPMYQSEAMWLNFSSEYIGLHQTSYPFAIKIAAGKVNAVTGKSWTHQLKRKPQDYVVSPKQPWLDGYCVKKCEVRQFVAMPLGAGYTAEEQVTGKAEHGGVQLIVYPMKQEVFNRRFPEKRAYEDQFYSMVLPSMACMAVPTADMGLAPGGRMRQEIYDDPFDFEDWDTSHSSRCFIHIANSLAWEAITGDKPPTTPPTAKSYSEAGLPWFD